MRMSARELLVPFLMPLVWHDRGANPRPTAPEADALTTRLSGPVMFFDYFLLVRLIIKNISRAIPGHVRCDLNVFKGCDKLVWF